MGLIQARVCIAFIILSSASKFPALNCFRLITDSVSFFQPLQEN
jgi:hypothetical protein